MKLLHKMFIILLIAIIPHSGCNTDELASLNENPNETDEIDWRYLFALGSLLINEMNAQSADASAMIQQWAFLERWADGDKYFRMSGGYFDLCYDEIVKNLVEVIRKTGPKGPDAYLVNLHNAARVARVFAYHICTDIYGDVPYSEANKGYDEGIFFPKYDHQRDIYLDLLRELSEAAVGFDANADKIGVHDLLYNGDTDKWKKFAYSLMLRLAMRISNVDPANAQLYIAEAIEGGVFTSNADNAFIPMETGPGRWTNANRISVLFTPEGQGGNGILSNTLVDFLRNHNDPRLMIISSGIGIWDADKVTDPALQRGMPNGHDVVTIREYEGISTSFLIDTTYSRVNELLLDWDDPILLQTYAEVELMLAEASLNGWHSGDPEEHYNNGVKAAMQMYDIFDPSFAISDVEVDAYLAANPFDPANGLEMIGTQYWAATFLNFWETWANWRRTEYPLLVPVNYPGNDTNGTIPRRINYSMDEANNNRENYNAAAERIGGDKMTTRVWWDGGK
jgi:hypothetical protein